MKRLLTFYFVLFSVQLHAQSLPAELMAGNKFVLYQHNLSRVFKKDSRLGIQHIVNILIRYHTSTNKKGLSNELMNQAYITYKLLPVLSLHGGVFYNNLTNYKLSTALQFSKKTKQFLWVVTPRIDYGTKSSYELFAIIEYRPELTDDLNLYLRFQGMTNHGPQQHNRSYQQLRAGVEHKQWMFGLAVNLDEYRADGMLVVNSGIFIRKELF